MTTTKNRPRGEGAAHPENGLVRLLDTMLTAATWALAGAAVAVAFHLAGRCLS